MVGEDDGGAGGELAAEAASEFTHRLVGEVVEEFGKDRAVERAAREVFGEPGLAGLGAGVVAETGAGKIDRAPCAVGGEEAQRLLAQGHAVAAVSGGEFEEAA